jgi:hypothetical protein
VPCAEPLARWENLQRLGFEHFRHRQNIFTALLIMRFVHNRLTVRRSPSLRDRGITMIDHRELESMMRWANAPVCTANLLYFRWFALALTVGLPLLLILYL